MRSASGRTSGGETWVHCNVPASFHPVLVFDARGERMHDKTVVSNEHLETGEVLASSAGPSEHVLEGTVESLPFDDPFSWWHGGKTPCGATRDRSPIQRERHAPCSTMRQVRMKARIFTSPIVALFLRLPQAKVKNISGVHCVKCRSIKSGRRSPAGCGCRTSVLESSRLASEKLREGTIECNEKQY